MNEVNGSAQNYFIYQPRVAETAPAAADTSQLTSSRWQSQMEHLFGLFEGAPGAAQVAAPAPLTKTTLVEPVAGRDGKVLSAETFLKADQYPGLHDKRLQTQGQTPLVGAPHFRQEGEGIYGVAQPTVEGIKNVLKEAGSGPGQNGKQAVWTNLRQEPVIYVNGKPLNLRSIKAPFYNQEAPGRTPEEADKLEQQLKQDVLAEAKKNGGYIALHDEAPGAPPRVVEQKVKVENVQTVQEVYSDLQKQGYNVKFQRIPVSDMKKPQDKDIDALVASLKDSEPGAPLIFNCHAGQGRTTTGMVLASLLRRGQTGDTSPVLKDQALRADIKEQGKHDPGNYRPIVQSVKDSEHMQASQQDADAVIGRYGDVHNLKTEVDKARKAAQAAKSPQERQADSQRTSDYLDRYHTVVSFDRYAHEQAPDFKVSYSDWKKQHPQQEKNLEQLQAAMGPAAGGPAYV